MDREHRAQRIESHGSTLETVADLKSRLGVLNKMSQRYWIELAQLIATARASKIHTRAKQSWSLFCAEVFGMKVNHAYEVRLCNLHPDS